MSRCRERGVKALDGSGSVETLVLTMPTREAPSACTARINNTLSLSPVKLNVFKQRVLYVCKDGVEGKRWEREKGLGGQCIHPRRVLV